MRSNRSNLLPSLPPPTKKLFNCTGDGRSWIGKRGEEEKKNWAICTLESKHTQRLTHTCDTQTLASFIVDEKI